MAIHHYPPALTKDIRLRHPEAAIIRHVPSNSFAFDSVEDARGHYTTMLRY